MIDLKPCPFCGSKIIQKTIDGKYASEEVYCARCGASAQSEIEWNTRQTEDALQNKLTRLAEERNEWQECANMLDFYSEYYNSDHSKALRQLNYLRTKYEVNYG